MDEGDGVRQWRGGGRGGGRKSITAKAVACLGWCTVVAAATAKPFDERPLPI